MQGIIFDFNGTLYWDSQLHYDAWREFSKILRGYEFSDEEMRDKMFGHTNEDIIEVIDDLKEAAKKNSKVASDSSQVTDYMSELFDEASAINSVSKKLVESMEVFKL